VDAGVRVAHIGKASVRYEIGLFAGDAPLTAARGHFVHVYVERTSRRPAALPEALQQVLRRLHRPPETP
jgi:acyl-CoA thioester hydrolase